MKINKNETPTKIGIAKATTSCQLLQRWKHQSQIPTGRDCLVLPDRRYNNLTTPIERRQIFFLPINKPRWWTYSSANEEPSLPKLWLPSNELSFFSYEWLSCPTLFSIKAFHFAQSLGWNAAPFMNSLIKQIWFSNLLSWIFFLLTKGEKPAKKIEKVME